MKYFLHWRVSVILLMLACGIQIDDGRYIRRTRMAMLHELFVGWYTFRPKLLAESYIILSTFRPLAETYIIYILLIYTIRPIKFFFIVSAKSCNLYFSDKFIYCTFRPKKKFVRVNCLNAIQACHF